MFSSLIRSLCVGGLLVTALSCQFSQAADLKITVQNVKSNQGEIRIALYNQAEQWLTKSYKRVHAPATEGSTTLSFSELPVGEYAIAIYHDKDGDGKMATNFMGIPSEPIGFSNNAHGVFGPPKFDAVKIVVGEEGQSIVVKLD